MIVFLVVLVFAGFLIVDVLTDRWRRSRLLAEGEPLHGALIDVEPRWVAGFKLPEALAYHHGHTWVHWVGPELAYVGVDDFARRLLGKDARVYAPPVGTCLGQGDRAITVKRQGEEARLLAPVSGEIVAVNPQLSRDPNVVFRDNYGLGWLYKIRSPRLFQDLPNLLHGTLAHRWMQDTRDRLLHQIMLCRGSVVQDGAVSIEDIASGLKPEEWRTLVGVFLAPRTREPIEEVS
jgi:glycine cleavage system H protein